MATPFFAYDSNARCQFGRHNSQSAEGDSRLPLFLNRSSGIMSGLTITTGPGLSINMAAGKALVNGILRSKSAGSVSAISSNFNIIILTGVGTLSAITGVTKFPSTFAVLAAAQASGSSIIALRDLRMRLGDYWLLAPGQATVYQLKTASEGIYNYDIGLNFFGAPTASQTILRYLCVRAISFPTSLVLSRAGSATAASASTVLRLRKNGTSFARITYGA